MLSRTQDPEDVNPNEDTSSQISEEQPTEPTPEEDPEITLPGGKTVKASEVAEWQKGYLRQDDYTRKTQEVAQRRQWADWGEQFWSLVQSNPERAHQIIDDATGQSSTTGQHGEGAEGEEPMPTWARQLYQQVYQLQTAWGLAVQVANLQRQFPDADVNTVVEHAQKQNIPDLVAAYKDLAWEEMQKKTKQTTQKQVEQGVRKGKAAFVEPPGPTASVRTPPATRPKNYQEAVQDVMKDLGIKKE